MERGTGEVGAAAGELGEIIRSIDGSFAAFTGVRTSMASQAEGVRQIEDAAMHAPEFSGFHDDPIDLLNTEDIELLAEEVAPGSSAAVLVFEHTWAKKLAGAVEGSGGFVVAREYIPESIVEAAMAAAQNS